MSTPLPNGGDPDNDNFPSGPSIGQSVPPFSLPDQNGRTITYPLNGQHQALLLFHRSADW